MATLCQVCQDRPRAAHLDSQQCKDCIKRDVIKELRYDPAEPPTPPADLILGSR